jgi:hypothetical protein
MLSRYFGRVAAAWHGKEAPSSEEWDDFLTQFRRLDLTSARILVLTEGGAPTVAQRAALMKILGPARLPVAVVSDHVGVRFVLTSFALVMKRIRGFTLRELDAAFAHLELTPDELTLARAFVAECRAERT